MHDASLGGDQRVIQYISKLIAEEHELRHRREEGKIDYRGESDRLHEIEEALDICWDMLRRRRALRETGGNPDEAVPRPGGEVEEYLQ